MDELEIIRHQQIGGLSLFLDTVDYRTSHFHSEWEIIWAVNGEMRLFYEQQTFRIPEGEVALVNPNTPHEMHKTGETCTFLCLQLSPERFPEISNIAVEDPMVFSYLNPEEQGKLKKWLLQAAYSYFYHKPFYEMECLGLAGQVFSLLLSRMPGRKVSWEEEQNQTKRNARLMRLQQFVDRGYMHKINLSDFARAEGCSLSYMSHFVKNALNQTFQEYVSTVRYNCACKLIAAGSTNMLDVCMESGFSDYRYFVKAFRKQSGMTPEEYSRSHGKRAADWTVRHSIHSLERFYTFSQSLELMDAWGPLLVPDYFEKENLRDSKLV